MSKFAKRFIKILLLIFPLLFAADNSFGLTVRNLDDEVSAATLLDFSGKSSLTLDAQIYYGDEDEWAHPVQTDFYLLDRSLVKILRAASFKPVFSDGKFHKLKERDYLEAVAQAYSSNDEESQLIAILITSVLRGQQKVVVPTNSRGIGEIKMIGAGNYYLFGIEKTENEILIWNQPVQIRAGSNRIEIDQYNADYLSEF